MNNNRTYIQAEISQLQDILASISEDAVIERMGYEHRLNELTQKLARIAPSVAAKTFNLTFKGTLLGVLPASKVFEFKISATDKIIKGKISPEFKDAASIHQEWLFKESTIDCKLVTVGQGTPRYTLIGISELHADKHPKL